jgi:hypothetical protein
MAYCLDVAIVTSLPPLKSAQREKLVFHVTNIVLGRPNPNIVSEGFCYTFSRRWEKSADTHNTEKFLPGLDFAVYDRKNLVRSPTKSSNANHETLRKIYDSQSKSSSSLNTTRR